MNQETCSHCCTKTENLTVKFDDIAIIENFNLHVNCKELIAVVGPNDTGKTTLLRAIFKEIPYSGNIYYRVKGSLNEKPTIGYVPKKLHFDRDNPIRVADFVGISISKTPVFMGIGKKIKQQIQSTLSQFGVTDPSWFMALFLVFLHQAQPSSFLHPRYTAFLLGLQNILRIGVNKYAILG